MSYSKSRFIKDLTRVCQAPLAFLQSTVNLLDTTNQTLEEKQLLFQSIKNAVAQMTCLLENTPLIVELEEMSSDSSFVSSGNLNLPVVSTELKGLKILFVDDDPLLRDLYVDLFQFAEAEVRTAESIEQVMTVLESFAPDVIASEILLADSDGRTLIDQIREHETRRGRAPTPILAITTHSRMMDYPTAVVVGFTEYVLKGTDPEVLEKTIARLSGRG